MTTTPRHVVLGTGAMDTQCQFAEPFIVESSRIANELGVQATSLEHALPDILAGYRDA